MELFMREVKSAVLIVGPNAQLQNVIEQIVKAKIINAEWTSSAAQAQLMIADHNRRFEAALINPAIGQASVCSIVRLVRMKRPLMPVYLFGEMPTTFKPDDLKLLRLFSRECRTVTTESVIEFHRRFSDKTEKRGPLNLSSRSMTANFQCFGSEVVQLLRRLGLIHFHEVDRVQHYLNRLPIILKPFLGSEVVAFQRFFENVECWQHGVVSSLVAIVLMPYMQMNSWRAVEILATAGMFHDVGVFVNSTTPEYGQNHPLLGAKALSLIDGVSDIVIQAVAQHHERRNGKGFPFGLGSHSINRTSEMMGVVDDLADLIMQKMEDPRLDLAKELLQLPLEGFSTPVGEAVSCFISNVRAEEKEQAPSICEQAIGF